MPSTTEAAARKETRQAPRILGVSAPLALVMDRVRRVASSDATILLTGESGVGKEVIARSLHSGHARRHSGPFIAVHCGAIPSNLIESELFGHVRGAFTGADRDREGRFEQAHGGTLFLDEVSTMGADMQVKLLRALQERTVNRVGGGPSFDVDVRVIAASNQDLRALVKSGAFRQDLYYRLNVVQIDIPPLRDRVEDIPVLALHFVERTCVRGGSSAKSIPADVMKILVAYPWPGNVRELENAMEASVVLAGDTASIDARDLPDSILFQDSASDGPMIQLSRKGTCLRSLVSGIEREIIIQSLRMAQGNKAMAARLLKLKRTTFVEKMRRLNLESTEAALSEN